MSTPARISVYGRICFVLILLVLLLSYVNAADSQDPVTVVTPTVIPVNETAVPTPLEMLSVTPSFTLMEEATALPAITQNITSTPTLLQISTIRILNQTSSQIAGLNTTDSSVPATVTSPSNTGGGYQEIHPLMHFTKDQLDEMQNQIAISPKYSAPKRLLTLAEPLTTGSKNLLSYLPYTPSERDQGSCGDCWVWASTGALEIDHNVKNGIFDRLSVQYFNSKYNSGQGSNWACCGGNLNYFTNWYNTDKTPIPWSNTNAYFGDASSSCDGSTAVPISSISTQPHYQLNSITYSTISTYGVGQATAINNIKSALDSNKAVEYMFFYGDSGWVDFFSFWGSKRETSIFDPTPHNGESETAGHAVIIVGYDDSTDPSNPYWLVLNSWGAPTNRPNGLFRVNMSMNYSAVYYYNGFGPYQQNTFQILNSGFTLGPTVTGVSPASGPAARAPVRRGRAGAR